MERSEVEQVLANWIEQANAPPGELSTGVDPAKWVAQQFVKWWQPRVASELSDAESAVVRAWRELERLGGWSKTEFGETMHELIHARDALSALQGLLGLPDEKSIADR